VIAINLVPGARKKRGGGAGFKLPDLQSLAASVKDPWLIATAAGWVLVVAALALFYFPRRAQVKGLEPRLAAAQREARRLQAVLRTKAETEAKRDSLIQQIEIIRAIDRERYIWPHILDQIAKALPPYTWLDDLSSRVAEGGAEAAAPAAGPSLTISGKSADIQAITRFVRNLEESAFLENATTVSTAVVTDQGRDVFTFVINAQFQQPDSTLLTTQPLAATLVQGYRSGAARGR
jgi:Tfp pilus assembly protein PilN